MAFLDTMSFTHRRPVFLPFVIARLFFLYFLTALLSHPVFAETEDITYEKMTTDLVQGDYKDLMKPYKSFLALVKADGNNFTLSHYYDFLARWENLDELEKWAKAEPSNFVPWTALGLAYFYKGERYRGADVIGTVSKENMDLFEQYQGKAETYLERAIQTNPDDPYPYVYLMGIGLNEGWPEKTMVDYFQRAIRSAPRCQTAIWKMGLHYSPLWGGSGPQMRKFVEDYAMTAPKGNYLRLLVVRYREEVWHAQGSHDSYWGNTPAWDETRQELEDYLAAHPKDLNTRAWYVFFAYAGRHYREAKAQFDVLGEHWNANSAHWMTRDYYMKARDLANQHANDPVQGVFKGKPGF